MCIILIHDMIISINISGAWGGGKIKNFINCTPKNKFDPVNKKYNWAVLVNECCIETPINHVVWKALLKKNRLRRSRDNIKNLENLLWKWIENQHKYHVYGPYPTDKEQELYIQDTINASLSGLLNNAVATKMFDKAIQEMYSFQYHSPRPDLAKVITSVDMYIILRNNIVYLYMMYIYYVYIGGITIS